MYADKDFKGNCETFTADDPDLNGNIIGNNKASSLTVVGDWRVCLYRSQNYAEGESCFGSDTSDLTNEPVGNDNASSIRVTPITCYNLNAEVNQTVGGSLSVSPAPNCGTRYKSGTVVQLTANAASGYSFTNWTGGASGSANPVSVTMDGNKTVTANFTADPVCYTLTTSANPSGGGSIGANPAPNCGSKYIAGTVVQLTANAASGYSFTNWTGGASGSANPVSVTMDGNKTVTANFTADPVCYTLTTSANPSGGGSVSANPAPNCGSRYTAGTVVQLTANAAPGYTFANWTGGASGSANPVSVTMDGNKTVTANFTADPVCYTLTTSANPSSGGSVSAIPPLTAGASILLGRWCSSPPMPMQVTSLSIGRCCFR